LVDRTHDCAYLLLARYNINTWRDDRPWLLLYQRWLQSYTPFIWSSKHRAVIEQTSSKCIQNTRARRVL